MAIIEWQKARQIQKIALWGRSMGAATAQNFTYNSNNNYVKCLILDSPFTNVAEMVRDTLRDLRGLPSIVTSAALMPIANTIKKETGHDVVNLDIKNLVQEIRVPAQFIVGNDDKITPNEKVQSMYQMYKGQPKRFLIVEGEHHTERDLMDLNFSINFVEGNIGFKLEDRESYVAPQIKAAKDRFKRPNVGNRNLQGVSEGRGGLEKVPGFKNDDSSSEDEGFWGKVGNSIKKGWNEVVEGTDKGWDWTKEKWNNIATSVINDSNGKIFGGCGCVDNVDTKNQGESYFNRDSIDSNQTDHQGGLPEHTLTQSIYPGQLRSPAFTPNQDICVTERSHKNNQDRNNRISHIRSREKLDLDQSFMGREDDASLQVSNTFQRTLKKSNEGNNRPQSNYSIKKDSRSSFREGNETDPNLRGNYETKITYENGKKVIRKSYNEPSERMSHRGAEGNEIITTKIMREGRNIVDQNGGNTLPPRGPVTRSIRYNANGQIISKNY